MATSAISELINIQRRFLRSTHLQRDFRDPGSMDGYVLTDTVRGHLRRIAGGLQPTSGQRAWRITGDYGSGKSSFALFLALYFAGKDSPAPSVLRRSLDLGSETPSRQPQFLPVLVVGSREPLALAVLRSVAQAIDQRSPKRSKLAPVESLRKALAEGRTPNDQEAVEIIQEINSGLIAQGGVEGLLIILDELGKFLEYAALHPERQDIYFLQQLAEMSTRSGPEPIITVGLLHQGFTAYADQLSQAAQKEWEKVAGRYEELIFDQPLDQVTHLIRAALGVKQDSAPRSVGTQAKAAMRGALARGWYGAAPAKSALAETAPGLYPLHPTVIPVLVRLFSRFGQNERSLFSFLLSTEPFGLQDFARQPAGPETFYRVHHLYDYAAANFGNRLSFQTYRNHWNHIDSLVRSFPAQDEDELAVLKTVGLLNLLNAPELLANEEAVAAAVSEPGSDHELRVRQTIQVLHKERHVLYLRGRSGGYCLWSHTSVNLEAAYEEAGRAVVQQQRVTARVKEYLDSRPIVARRHYIQTGNLRHFEVCYCGLEELEGASEKPLAGSDGRIVIPLCESPDEVRLATDLARRFTKREDVIIGVTDPLGSLAGLLHEVERWSWVQQHTPELKEDRYAAEEVARQLALATHTLEKRIHHYAGLGQTSSSGALSIAWYHAGRRLRVRTSKELVSQISDLCEALYPSAPRVHNEIINRRALSSAAASARMRLIERMFTTPDQPLLGMDASKKPPEMSIYLSLLQAAGLHAQVGGAWKVQIPPSAKDPCSVRPALLRIREILESHPDARFNLDTIFSELSRPPYGLRDGILPVLLVVLLLTHQHEVALYENGTFLSGFGSEEILRLTKDPASFELQLCRIKGVRRQLFDKLASVLDETAPAASNGDVLSIVRPLCKFVAKLPEYTRNTERLDLIPRALRDAILRARDPNALVFQDIPAAFGLPPISPERGAAVPRDQVQDYVEALKFGLEGLRAAFPSLLERIRSRIAKAFGIPTSAAGVAQLRKTLSARSEQFLMDLLDIELKAFCLRASDTSLSEADWLESMGSLIATTPPSRWKDSDEEAFPERLDSMVKKFGRVEAAKFSRNPPSGAKAAFRLTLTSRDGREKDQVVHLLPSQEGEMVALTESISRLLENSSRTIILPVMTQLLWKLLDQEGGDRNV